MNKEKSFYISTEFYKDKRIKTVKSIVKPNGYTVMVFWFDLISLASKYDEKENLKNCLNREKLPKIISDRTPEFIDSALKILENSNLLSIKSISNIVRFEE